MKKLISMLLVLAMVLTMAACGASAPAATEAPAADNNVPMQYIKHDEAKELLENDEYVFFDIRKAADSSANSIPGAQAWDMDAAKEGDAEAGKATMTEATKGLDKKIILVCYSGKRYAQAATNALSAIGYDMSKVYTLEGGFTNWSEVLPELTTAGPVEAEPEEVTLTFWHAMSGANEEAMIKITEDFMKEYPHIKVELQNQGGYTDLFDKLMAAAKANQLPNLAQIYSNRLSWYVDKGLVLDLAPYMNNAEIGFTAEELADIPEMFLDNCIWDGKQFALPFNKSMMVLYYNVDMLAEAGVEVPTTWEEWAEASKKLTKDTDNDGEPDIYGTVFANNLSTDIAPWVHQAGGTALLDDATGTPLFESDAMKEAITFLNGMFQDGSARFADEDKNANVPVQQGRAAMCVASTSALPTIEKNTMEGINIHCAALPANKTDAQLYYGTNVTIYDVGTDAEKEAAWLYLKYFIATDNTAYFASQTGYMPVRKSAMNSDVYKDVLAAKPMKQVPMDNFDKGFQGDRCIGCINALNALGDEIKLVFAGEKDLDTALADAQINGQKAVDEARNS